MKKNIKTISYASLILAVAFVCSNIKIFKLPTGGSITFFSMFIISLAGYFFGIRVGFLTSFTYGLLQMIADPYFLHPMQILLDYVLAFLCFGITGFFCDKKNGLNIGYVLSCIFRWIFSSLSGIIFFAEFAPEGMSPFIYTIGYNASYIFSEMILTLIIINITAVKNIIFALKKQVIESD